MIQCIYVCVLITLVEEKWVLIDSSVSETIPFELPSTNLYYCKWMSSTRIRRKFMCTEETDTGGLSRLQYSFQTHEISWGWAPEAPTKFLGLKSSQNAFAWPFISCSFRWWSLAGGHCFTMWFVAVTKSNAFSCLDSNPIVARLIIKKYQIASGHSTRRICAFVITK